MQHHLLLTTCQERAIAKGNATLFDDTALLIWPPEHRHSKNTTCFICEYIRNIECGAKSVSYTHCKFS